MSLIIGKSQTEHELTCPVCEGVFDASNKIDKAKYPYIKTKCPLCKAKIGISLPIFGGTTKVTELEVPSCMEPLKTEAKFTIN